MTEARSHSNALLLSIDVARAADATIKRLTESRERLQTEWLENHGERKLHWRWSWPPIYSSYQAYMTEEGLQNSDADFIVKWGYDCIRHKWQTQFETATRLLELAMVSNKMYVTADDFYYIQDEFEDTQYANQHPVLLTEG